MKRFVLLNIILLLFINAFSQNPGCLQMGMQIFPPYYYGSSYPFVNILKNADHWHTRNTGWVEGGQNNWETNYENQIAVDENGYPLELPANIPGSESGQGVFTFWAAATSLPSGNYVILYDGEGEIVISGGGVNSIISNEQGRIEFSFSPTDDYLELFIKSSQQGNHIRNMRVLLPGTEETHLTEPWTNSWKEKISPFKVIRFMEFAHTNGATITNWEDRTPVDYFSFGSDDNNGVPYELMIQLCNDTHSDAWINIPHLANENYIIELANLFKSQLDPDLKIYIEYSNETWNWMFEQTSWLDENGDQSLDWPERTVGKIGWALQTWTNAFGDNPARVVRVLATQGAWFDIGDRQFAQMELDGTSQYIDAISIAAYLPINPSLLSANSTPEDVLQNSHEASFGINNNFFSPLKQYANLAIEKNKKLIFYEGGQHFTPDPFGTDQPYNQALIDVQTTPGIYNTYMELFDSLKTLISDEMVFIHHVLVSPLNGPYGSWGSLENQFEQNAPYDIIAPKYQALLDQLNDCQITLAADDLVSFNAFCENDHILLEWMTNNYDNSGYFIIQRSLDSEQWEDIEEVETKSNSDLVERYRVYDNEPENGMIYYRLKQISSDDSFVYSKIISVNYKELDLTISPNPVSDFVSIDLSDRTDGIVYITDTTGKTVFSRKINDDYLQIDLSGYTSGIYIIFLQTKTRSISDKIVVQK